MTARITAPIKFFLRVSVLMAAIAFLGVVATTSGAAEGNTTLVSVDSSGNQANHGVFGSTTPSISADGRFVAFWSDAPNLVPNDTNDWPDVFVRDRQTGTTEMVSAGSSGSSGSPSISADGRYVAFVSGTTNLVAGDTNNNVDVFVRDRQTGTTEMVSVDSSGNQANGASSYPSISSDGRYVAFTSDAQNLVTNDTDVRYDVFVRDRQTGTTEMVSVDSSGNQTKIGAFHPSVSADGRFIAFSSHARNLVADDTNGTYDVFVRDRQTGTTQRVSVDSSGEQANDYSITPSISADGRFVAFSSHASNLVADDTNGNVDVFVRDRQTGTTQRVNEDSSGNQAINGDDPSVSADGRFVAFSSWDLNLGTNDTNGAPDVFVHDRQTGATEGVSVDSSVDQANDFSNSPSISADGRYVAFGSGATNLVAGDTNNNVDVFVRDRQTGTNELVSVGDSTAPRVTDVVPTGGATSVALKTNVVATFSEKMKVSTITKTTFKLYKLVKNPDGTTTAKQIENVTVTPSSDGLKATLNPFGTSEGQLAKNTRYKAVVSTGALDVFGNRLDQKPTVSGYQPKVWHFKTRG